MHRWNHLKIKCWITTTDSKQLVPSCLLNVDCYLPRLLAPFDSEMFKFLILEAKAVGYKNINRINYGQKLSPFFPLDNPENRTKLTKNNLSFFPSLTTQDHVSSWPGVVNKILLVVIIKFFKVNSPIVFVRNKQEPGRRDNLIRMIISWSITYTDICPADQELG